MTSDSSHLNLYFLLSQKIFRDPSRESFGHLVAFKLHEQFFGIPTLRQLRNGLGDWILEKYTFATNGLWIEFLFVFGHWLFDINNRIFT